MKEIKNYLPNGWEEKAKECGALKRSWNIKTAEELLALNMLCITNEGSFQINVIFIGYCEKEKEER